ncbi:uncharacterized protein KZ484_017740 [Pholidichthys leucotaenia]
MSRKAEKLQQQQKQQRWHVGEATQNYNMSLHENSEAVEIQQSTKTVQTHNRLTDRLYPSLPATDRYEFYLPDPPIREKPHRVAEFRPKILMENIQLEGSSCHSDVKLKEQIRVLEQQREELLSINERWAKEYHTMVQYYREKVQVLRALQQHGHNKEGDDWSKQVTFNNKIEFNTQTGEGDISSDFVEAEQEVREPHVQTKTLTRREQHQHEEIRRLNKALKEALQASQSVGVSGETLQDLWKHQAEVYKEDFLKERKDREKLKARCLDLEKKFKKVHNELHALKSQGTWTQPPQPLLNCPCTNQAKGSNWEVHQVNQNCIQLQRRYTLDDKK